MADVILLRELTDADLAILFEQQLEPAANRMAAFTAQDPTNRDAFTAKWTRIVGDHTIAKKAVLFRGHVVGNILSHRWFGKPEVSYWIGNKYRGEGLPPRRSRSSWTRSLVVPFMHVLPKTISPLAEYWKNAGSQSRARTEGFPTHVPKKLKNLFWNSELNRREL